MDIGSFHNGGQLEYKCGHVINYSLLSASLCLQLVHSMHLLFKLPSKPESLDCENPAVKGKVKILYSPIAALVYLITNYVKFFKFIF